ncbi:MAG: hypothetical protein FWF80_07615, partial [Defluviitaleaceae bacterium]|nr:hypothetical protein [Defluviitaleaceae bacterium]
MKEKARKILAMLITAVFVMGITPVVWAQDNNGGAGGGSSDIGIPPQANPISPNNSAVPEVLFDAFAFSPLVTSVLPDRRLTTDERQAWVDNYWAQSGPTAFELEVAAVVNRIRVE